MNDVIVVGGGVAGSSLALVLGRAGLSVALFEQHSFPREKACAEGMMPAGVGVLERLGMIATVRGGQFRGVRHCGHGRQLEAVFPVAPGLPSFGLGLRRLHLDASLFAAARATAGVLAHEGIRVEGPLVEGGRVAGIRAGGATFRARLTVAADGPRSLIRRKANLEGRARVRSRLGLRVHYRLAPGVAVPDFVEVYLGDGHELYLTPLPGGEVSLAALTGGEKLPGKPEEALGRWINGHPALAARLESAIQVSEVAGQMPLASQSRRGVIPGLVLLGDAAGFVDPVTGAGMAQALLSAELLGTVLAHPAARNGSVETLDAALDAFDIRRNRLLRDTTRLTRMVLALVERPFWGRQVMRLLTSFPGLYRHLVGVAGGLRPWWPFSARPPSSDPRHQQDQETN